jgi:predicted DNA-binding protein
MAKGKPYTLTLRLEENEGRAFAALASLNGASAADVLREYIRKYIEDNKDAAVKKLRGS